MILLLTTIHPDREAQAGHDRQVLDWFDNPGAVTIMQYLDRIGAGDAPDAETRMSLLMNEIRLDKPTLVDVSIDHYWRDTITGETGLPCQHEPFVGGKEAR